MKRFLVLFMVLSLLIISCSDDKKDSESDSDVAVVVDQDDSTTDSVNDSAVQDESQDSVDLIDEDSDTSEIPDTDVDAGSLADEDIKVDDDNDDLCSINNGGCDPLTECTFYQNAVKCSPCPAGHTGDGEIGCMNVVNIITTITSSVLYDNDL